MSEQLSRGVTDVNPIISYRVALASIRLLKEVTVIDLTVDDFDFLTQEKLWLPIERSRVRRCVEACVYGGLDYVGFPRFPVPAEFVAAAIVVFVHPQNMQIACLAMEGCQFTENLINGVEQPLSPSQIFAHVLRLYAGIDEHLDAVVSQVRDQLNFRGDV